MWYLWHWLLTDPPVCCVNIKQKLCGVGIDNLGLTVDPLGGFEFIFYTRSSTFMSSVIHAYLYIPVHGNANTKVWWLWWWYDGLWNMVVSCIWHGQMNRRWAMSAIAPWKQRLLPCQHLFCSERLGYCQYVNHKLTQVFSAMCSKYVSALWTLFLTIWCQWQWLWQDRGSSLYRVLGMAASHQ